MADNEFQSTEPESKPVLTGEDVELSGDHFLEDVTSVGEVGLIPEAEGLADSPDTAHAEGSVEPEFGTAQADAPSGSYAAAETTEFSGSWANSSLPPAPPASAPARADLPPTGPSTPDVLENRVEAVFSEEDETLVPPAPTQQIPQTSGFQDTGIMRRSLVEPTQPMPTRSAASPEFPQISTESILAGATVLPTVPSRAGARWLSAIVFVLLTPVVWYLLADAGARMFVAQGGPWETGTLNFAALGEFVGGLALIVLLGIVAAQSSLGLLLAGIVFTVVGLPFVVVPGYTATFIEQTLVNRLGALGPFGDNLSFHLATTGGTGIITAVGVAMIVSSWVVYRVRQKGREEEALRAEVAAANPDGLKARWARKASRS